MKYILAGFFSVIIVSAMVCQDPQALRHEARNFINAQEGIRIDIWGNVEVDLGSASAGRFRVNINKSNMKLDLRGEEPGCADICPERALIWFECKGEPCVSDPAFPGFQKHSSSVAEFLDVENGARIYGALVQFKYYGVTELAIEEQSQTESFDNPKYKTNDGHMVRSRGEKMIDDFLYQNEIPHAYEKRLPSEQNFFTDFLIPASQVHPNIYIEYWGLDNEKYNARRKRKTQVYERLDLVLIDIENKDMFRIEDRLTEKLAPYNVKILKR